MVELLLFLLPVAAASGWYFAKHNERRGGRRQVNGFSSDYFRGLNFLLNEEPDKAIEIFVKMMEVDQDTVEMHLALGNLFRRRGEVDRAIRIHQNLIGRATLNGEQRPLALLELGQDFMHAGLLDRAEHLFLELVDSSAQPAPALRHLMDIYQQEKDWEKAIAAARQLESVSGQPLSPVVAQFQCELADRTAAKTHGNDPRALYAEALATDPNCVRASLSLARIDAAVGDWRGSIHTLKQVEHQDADYLPEILGPLCAGYRKIGDTDGLIDYLNACLRRQGSVSLVLALAEMVRETDGDQKAVEFIAEQLRQRPSVRGLDRLIELQMYHGDEEGRSDLSILKDLTTKLLESKPVYRCRSCGFASRSLYWQCPSCKSWNTVKPIHGVEGE